MADLRRWTAVTAAASSLSLVGVIGAGPGLAGAAQSADALGHSTGAASPGAVPIVPGTYRWFIDGANTAKITFAENNTFTSTLGTNDSGTWVQSGKTVGLSITGGADALYGCVFAGHTNTAGAGISYAAKPGNWVCPTFGSGTFYIKAGGAAASEAHGNVFAQSGAIPATAGSVVPGTYHLSYDGNPPGTITLTGNNTYHSSINLDTGTWVQGGSTVALSITGGRDARDNCLLVGKVNTSGTAIGTTAKPGHYACIGGKGTFVIS
jgi:hypothetical protein